MPALPVLLKLTLFLCSATVASRLGFHLVASTCLSTRSIRSTKAACFAGAMVLANPLFDYGRTSPESLDASGPASLDVQAADRWRRSPFYSMLQTGESLLRRRLNANVRRILDVIRLARSGNDRLRCDHFSLCR